MGNKDKGKTSTNLNRAPNAFLYGLLYILCWLLSKLIFRTCYKRTTDFKKCDGPMLIIGNHSSYLDAPLTLVGAGFKRMHFVGGDFLYNKKTEKFLDWLGIISKNQFQPDVKTVLRLVRTLRAGRRVMIFPEGQRSVNGSSSPIAPQFARLVKRVGVTVATIKCKGSYLAWPRWSKGFFRPGKITVESDILLTPDMIAAMDSEMIHSKIEAALNISDYDYQLAKKKPGKYLTSKPAAGLDTILHHCPACHQPHSMESSGKTLFCSICGWAVKLALDGFFINTRETKRPIFTRIDKWHQWQQQQLATFFAENEDAVLTFTANLQKRRGRELSPSIPGQVTLDAPKLSFKPEEKRELAALLPESENDEDFSTILSFPRVGQEGLYARYGRDFRQANRLGTWVITPEIKSWPIVVHDWIIMQ